jgi:hypothetical protein
VSTQREVVQQVDRVSPVARMHQVQFLAVLLDEQLEGSFEGREFDVRALGDRYAIVGPRGDTRSGGT